MEDNRSTKKSKVKLEDVLKDIETNNVINNVVINLQNFDGFTDEEEGVAQIMLM